MPSSLTRLRLRANKKTRKSPKNLTSCPLLVISSSSANVTSVSVHDEERKNVPRKGRRRVWKLKRKKKISETKFLRNDERRKEFARDTWCGNFNVRTYGIIIIRVSYRMVIDGAIWQAVSAVVICDSDTPPNKSTVHFVNLFLGPVYWHRWLSHDSWSDFHTLNFDRIEMKWLNVIFIYNFVFDTEHRQRKLVRCANKFFKMRIEINFPLKKLLTIRGERERVN